VAIEADTLGSTFGSLRNRGSSGCDRIYGSRWDHDASVAPNKILLHLNKLAMVHAHSQAPPVDLRMSPRDAVLPSNHRYYAVDIYCSADRCLQSIHPVQTCFRTHGKSNIWSKCEEILPKYCIDTS
jgi:hypothetical protein